MQLRLCFLVVVTVAQAMSADQTNETDIDDGSAVPDFQTSKESAALDEEVNVTTEDSNVSTRAFGNSTAELEIRSTTPEATVDLQSTTSFVTDDGAITVENSSTATGGETTTSTIEELHRLHEEHVPQDVRLLQALSRRSEQEWPWLLLAGKRSAFMQQQCDENTFVHTKKMPRGMRRV
ncbi:unnamed protein product [Heligmosomoides polygyrus]|uniref:Secreted protein n=1 Tax=Heligmosomoides polygyrus TaxID=6339 RepID=A0A183F2K4_HELPZ|nr:unnamed protein product [Heligmosomoides polygyrus]